LLLLIVKCSDNHPTLQYSKDEFVDIHSCTGAQERGQQDSDCNGNGAREMGQQQRGNGATETLAIDQSIAMGHWVRSNWSNLGSSDSDCNGNGAHDRSIVCYYIAAQNVKTRQRRRSFAEGQRQWGNRSNCNSNGAPGHWGNSDSDCNGNGDRISIVRSDILACVVG
jgi:hypothetical protein